MTYGGRVHQTRGRGPRARTRPAGRDSRGPRGSGRREARPRAVWHGTSRTVRLFAVYWRHRTLSLMSPRPDPGAQDPVADKSTSRSWGTPEARRAQHDSERLPCRGRASPPVLLLRSGHRQHPSEAPARLMSPDRAQNDRWAMILTCILSSDDARSLGGEEA